MNRNNWMRAGGFATLFSVTFVVYLRTLAPGLTWRHGGGDGGDLATAVAAFGIPHPPGYPTFVLLGRLFLLLPFGDEAYRLNLMSAFFASAATAVFYGLAVDSLGSARNRDAWLAPASAGVAALILAFSPMVWSQAIITEVYTLHLFFVASALWALWRWHRNRRGRDTVVLGLLLGLGAGNHLTIMWLAVCLGVVMLALKLAGRNRIGRRLSFIPSFARPSAKAPLRCPAGRRGLVRAGLGLTAGLILGLGVYLYLPIASQYGAPSPWGRMGSPAEFLAHVSAGLYRDYLFSLPLVEAPRRLVALWALLVSDFQVLGLALAAIGLARQFRCAPGWTWLLAALLFGSVAFAVGYNTDDSYRYLLPVWVCSALWCAEGMGVVFRASRQAASASSPVLRRVGALRRFAPPALVAVFALLVFATAWLRYPALDLSRADEAERFAMQALMSLPPGAVLVSNTDRQTFALWYYADVRRIRPDVAVIDRDLYAYAPYRAYLRARWATLLIGADDSLDSWIERNRAAHAIFALDARSPMPKLYIEAAHALGN